MGNQRILIIDDDLETLELCTRLLTRKEYHVMAHLGCDNLFAIVEEFSPHLIFMDHNMPHLCGTDAIQLLKSQSNFKHIPIILFSAEIIMNNLQKKAERISGFKKHLHQKACLRKRKGWPLTI